MLEVTLGLEILEALREHAKDIENDEIPTWHVDRPNNGDRYYYWYRDAFDVLCLAAFCSKTGKQVGGGASAIDHLLASKHGDAVSPLGIVTVERRAA